MDIEINEAQEIIKNLESGGELSIKEEKYLKVAKLCVQLAAENVALKAACGGDGSYRNCPACTFSEYVEAPEIPATDRIVAGIKADGVDEFKGWMLSTGYPWEGDWIGIGRMTDKFAKQLREGADK